MLPTFLKQILRVRAGGFTLMEVMVATGLTGIVSLAIVQLFGQTAKIQQESQVRSELMQLRFLIKNILSNQANCEATFGVPTGGLDVSSIIREAPDTVIDTPIVLPGLMRSDPTQPGGGRVAIAPGSKFGGRLDISSVELLEYSPRTISETNTGTILDSGVIELRVVIGRQVYETVAGGAQRLVGRSAEIITPVVVTLNSSLQVSGCSYDSSLTPQRIYNETCRAFVYSEGGDVVTGSEDGCSYTTPRDPDDDRTPHQRHREKIIKEKICLSINGTISEEDGTCRHPYANFTCNGGIISGQDHQGRFVCTMNCPGQYIVGLNTNSPNAIPDRNYICGDRPCPKGQHVIGMNPDDTVICGAHN